MRHLRFRRSIVCFTLLFAACLVGCKSKQKSPSKQRSANQTVDPSWIPLHKKFTEEQTFAFILPQLPDVAAVGKPRAENCKVCHSNVYKDWSQSTHAAALRDLQYQAELSKDSSPRWLCLNCHIPVQNQRKTIIKYLKKGSVFHPIRTKNPGFDPVMRKEGITCATCHVRKDKLGQSYILGAVGSKFAPHPVKTNKALLRKMCLRCHDPKGKRLTRHLLCWFHTREELEKGPQGGKKDCVDCHMPTYKARLVPSWKHLPKRTMHAHHWVGGGVPKSFSGYKTLLKRGYHTGLAIRALQLSDYQPKSKLLLRLAYQNKHAGHWLPSADPERFLRFLLTLQDAKGATLKQETLRIGQTWKWEPKAEKVGDNRLKPNETRVWEPSFQLPPSLVGVKLVVKVYHVRLSSKTAKYMAKHAPKSSYLDNETKKKLAKMGYHYPLATLLFRKDIQLDTKQSRAYSPKELLELSYQERNKPLNQRDY